jgi:GT2 family glycosyltransferase
MPSPETCIIVINYRTACDTAACIRSLLDSTVPVEIVVVDNTPNDADLEKSLGFASGATILRASENLGFGRGNNLGIRWALRHSQCKYVFLLNNDTLVQGNSIETLERAMAVQPEVGIMVPRIAYLDHPELLWYGGGVVDWRRASVFTPGINKGITEELALRERDVTFATGCALFFRRSALIELGGFDPRFFMYEEDVELCLRAREIDVRIRYLPSAFILHRAQGSNADSNHSRTDFWSPSNPRLPFLCYHVMRNRILNVALHARGRNLVVAVCFFPLFMLRRAGPFLLHGRFDAILAMLHGAASSLFQMRRMPGTELDVATSRETRIP